MIYEGLLLTSHVAQAIAQARDAQTTGEQRQLFHEDARKFIEKNWPLLVPPAYRKGTNANYGGSWFNSDEIAVMIDGVLYKFRLEMSGKKVTPKGGAP